MQERIKDPPGFDKYPVLISEAVVSSLRGPDETIEDYALSGAAVVTKLTDAIKIDLWNYAMCQRSIHEMEEANKVLANQVRSQGQKIAELAAQLAEKQSHIFEG